MTTYHQKERVVIRGAGEMASGVIKLLHQAGYEVIALEQPAPSCIRRPVCFAEAVCEKIVTVEDIIAELADSVEIAVEIASRKRVPVLIDPEAGSLAILKPTALIDGRLLKKSIDTTIDMAPVVIGLGPGFTAGDNCHVAVETNRGPDLGRVIYDGSPRADTGEPASVNGVGIKRVLRAPASGMFTARHEISDTVAPGEIIGHVDGIAVVGQIGGIVRGLIRDGSKVVEEQKIGDIDPRGKKEYCYKISDKANAIGEGALKALLVLKAG
jgi:xanthine dehydrogenase accessory factor